MSPPATAGFIRGEVVGDRFEDQIVETLICRECPRRGTGPGARSGSVEVALSPGRQAPARLLSFPRSITCVSALLLAWVPVAGACAVAATGFPRRNRPDGVPGGRVAPGRPLFAPGANVVVDRGRDRRARVRRGREHVVEPDESL